MFVGVGIDEEGGVCCIIVLFVVNVDLMVIWFLVLLVCFLFGYDIDFDLYCDD